MRAKEWFNPYNVKANNKKRKTSNSTPGKTKGGTCTASPLDKSMTKRGRSYKDPNYGKWFFKKMSRGNQVMYKDLGVLDHVTVSK